MGMGARRRLVERFEWHYTPKLGSWLDMAEGRPVIVQAGSSDRGREFAAVMRSWWSAARNRSMT
jgi:hypothetical protein